MSIVESIDETNPRGVIRELAEVLSALTVVIEPLASRVEDVTVLAAALLDDRRAKGDVSCERFSRAALDALVVYPWPRDFDELAEAVDHAAGRGSGAAIGVEHLPLAIRSYRPSESSAAAHATQTPLDDAVARYELRLINAALEAADGNRAEAARQLGISRARLLRKIADAIGETDAAN